MQNNPKPYGVPGGTPLRSGQPVRQAMPPTRRLIYAARGTMPDGSRYIRFPQSPEHASALYILCPDGGAVVAVAGQLAVSCPPGSGDAELIHRAHATWESGQVPEVPAIEIPDFSA